MLGLLLGSPTLSHNNYSSVPQFSPFSLFSSLLFSPVLPSVISMISMIVILKWPHAHLGGEIQMAPQCLSIARDLEVANVVLLADFP